MCYAAAITADGKWAVIAGHYDARVWDLEHNKVTASLSGRVSGIMSAALGDSQLAVGPSGSNAIPEAVVWDLRSGQPGAYLPAPSEDGISVSIAAGGGRVLLGGVEAEGDQLGTTAPLWDTQRLRMEDPLQHETGVHSALLTPDGNWAFTLSDYQAFLWEAGKHEPVRRFADLEHSAECIRSAGILLSPLTRPGEPACITAIAISPNGRLGVTGNIDGRVVVWDLTKEGGEPAGEFRHAPLSGSPQIMSVAVRNDGRVYAADFADRVHIWVAGREDEAGELKRPAPPSLPRVFDTGAPPENQPPKTDPPSTDPALKATVAELAARAADDEDRDRRPGDRIAVSADGRRALTSGFGRVVLWDLETNSQIRELQGEDFTLESKSLTISPDGEAGASVAGDSVRVWNLATFEYVDLYVLADRQWAVVSPDGRFDTNVLEGELPLHWILDDDPMRALPLAIFMRDYYTPRLLARMLAGEKLPPLPAIGDIWNRVQPEVEIVKVEAAGNAERARVTVRAASQNVKGQASGLQDLRVFLDGQLVGLRRNALKDGEYVFDGVRLPGRGKAMFSAYAFNSARIKSETASREYEYQTAAKRPPQAFLLHIGVNHYQAAGCELRFAVRDAMKLRTTLEPRLRAQGFETHAIELVSGEGVFTATRDGIRKALQDIAAQASPGDAFLLSFAGHGYTNEAGEFYILPGDVQGSCLQPDRTLTASAISASDLADWLQPIDAGTMTFILDSCYSASSVEANGFKPGPMGNQGLGQLAYDKRMRILAASQSDQQAFEDARLQQGLLTYLLTERGLSENQADWKPVDHRITLGEWLSYAVEEVPKLTRARLADFGRGVRAHTGKEQPPLQVPALFDFSKSDDFVLQKQD